MMTRASHRYLEACRRIPAGETRSFLELAALAGRPGAARAAGRALASCPARSDVPWHRVVPADGAPARGGGRAALQIRRLRREGARPRPGETIRGWAARVGARLVAHLPARSFRPASDPEIDAWPAERVEPLADRAQGLSRGFAPEDGRPGDAPPASRLPRPPQDPRAPLEERLAALDWEGARRSLGDDGLVRFPEMLSPAECWDLRQLWEVPDRFERSISMGPKGYGIGEYRYWREPAPEPLRSLRRGLYVRLLAAARCDRSPPPGEAAFPPTLTGLWRRCRQAGQQRASSILLRYGTGGINHPHRDVYGKVWFPFQALVCLSRAGRDFHGGEFLLLEERPGGAERCREVAVSEGDVVIFASQQRWERIAGRWRRIPVRHAMRTVTAGERWVAGIVFPLAD